MSETDFPAVYLCHGQGGSPNGSVKHLEDALLHYGLTQKYVRPLLPHAAPSIPPSDSVRFLQSLAIPEGAAVIGISLGGLVAAKVQETGRPDLYVVAINAPTWAGDTELHRRMKNRIVLFSSADSVIAGRIDKWPELAKAYDLPWLAGHDTDPHVGELARLIVSYLAEGDQALG